MGTSDCSLSDKMSYFGQWNSEPTALPLENGPTHLLRRDMTESDRNKHPNEFSGDLRCYSQEVTPKTQTCPQKAGHVMCSQVTAVSTWFSPPDRYPSPVPERSSRLLP